MTEEAVIETSFDAAPDKVWEALTSPEGMEQWMGEGSAIDDEGDLWLRDFVTGEPKQGRVRTFDPDGRLEFDWWPEDDPESASFVSIVLEPADTGTRLIVTERRAAGVVAASAMTTTAATWEWRSAAAGVTLSEHRAIEHRVLGAC